MSGVELELPLPPSVNHMYVQRGFKKYLSKEYVAFKKAAWGLWLEAGSPKLSGRLAYDVTIHYGAKHRNDVTNRLKALEDALKGHLFDDDEQIDIATVRRGHMIPGKGCCVVRFWEI